MYKRQPQELDYTKALEAVGVAIAQQKLFPSLDALPKPPALSKSAAAEGDARRRMFQVAMDSAHHCQVWTLHREGMLGFWASCCIT